MIAGLEAITGGEIAIGGRVVNELEPKDRDIAMVFQNYALYPHMSVYDNMSYGLRIRGMSKAEIEARVQKAAKILELGSFLQRKPRQLSGGQRQRVAMGRAIVREPAVFLFDEPLSNLDAKLRVQMRIEIKRLHQSIGTTSVYVTHDQVEAMTLGDRLIVMNAGRAEQIGSPIDVYDRPATHVRRRLHRLARHEHAARAARRRRVKHRARRRAPCGEPSRPNMPGGRSRSAFVPSMSRSAEDRRAPSRSRSISSRRSAPTRWCTAISARARCS